MPDAAARRTDSLGLRVLSAVVMIPAALAAVWFGAPWITLVVALAGLAMGWEWGRLSAAGQWGSRASIVMAAIVLSVVAAGAGAFILALAVAAMGAVAAALIQRGRRRWAVAGTLWIAGGCVAFLWIGTAPRGGPATLFLLLAVVWASDIFAYLVGRTVGGPRLAPQLSPNKTWSGVVGGLAGAAAIGVAAAGLASAPFVPLVAISLVLGVAAQGGDLAESWAKRRFAVKDMSGLIPGHGGVLDRLDGLLAAAIALALLTIFLGDATLELG
jgi:phosphatidate cytidylyltransferase